MIRWLASLALVASLCAGCSGRSSLYVANDTGGTIVVRVFYNDFAESFGFRIPAGTHAWAWSPLEGGVAGPIAVYDTTCHVTWHAAIRPDGGTLTLDATGAVSLGPPPPATAVSPSTGYLDYTDACAESGSPGR